MATWETLGLLIWRSGVSGVVGIGISKASLDVLADLFAHLGKELWWVELLLSVLILILDLIGVLSLSSSLTLSSRSLMGSTIVSVSGETGFLQLLLHVLW